MSKEIHDPDMLGDQVRSNASAMIRGPEARDQRRRAALKQRVTIRLDAEVIEQFKALAPDGRGYQGLINQALREWLVAGSLSKIVESEIQRFCDQATETFSHAIDAASHSHQ